MGTQGSPTFNVGTIFYHSGKRIVGVNISPSKRKLKVKFNNNVQRIIISDKSAYIKYEKLRQEEGKSYPLMRFILLKIMILIHCMLI